MVLDLVCQVSVLNLKKPFLFWIIVLLLVILPGCQAVLPVEKPTPVPSPALPVQNLLQFADPQEILANPVFRFGHLTNNDGLSQSRVYCGLQDHKGWMWFCTGDGLNRYDGQTVTVFRHEPDRTGSLSDNLVRSIFEDNRGVLWIGTDNGLNRYEPATGNFTAFMHSESDPGSISNNVINMIFQDRQGRLWVGTDYGLNLFETEQNRFTLYYNPEDRVAPARRVVRCMAQDADGILWLGTEGGLQLLDPQTGTFLKEYKKLNISYLRSRLAIYSILISHNHEVWIGSSNGVVRFDEENRVMRSYHQAPPGVDLQSDLKRGGKFVETGDPGHQEEAGGLSNNQVNVIFQDSLNLIWVGTSNGLNLFDSKNERFFYYQHDPNQANSLSSDVINTMTQDRSGLMWVMTENGVNKFDLAIGFFKTFQNNPKDNNSLQDNNVFSILEDSKGTLWVGNLKGLDRIDRQHQRIYHYTYSPFDMRSISKGNITCLLEDREGLLWIGTSSGGLSRYNAQTDDFTRFTHVPLNEESLTNNIVGALYEDRNGNLWIGTGEGYLNRLDASRLQYTHYLLETGSQETQPKNVIRTITQDSKGKIWVGTAYGLYSLDPLTGEIERFVSDPHNLQSLSDDFITTILVGDQDELWIGTNGGGLNMFEPSARRFRHYQTRNGLPSDIVYSLLEDTLGRLWISTNNGLSVLNVSGNQFKNFDIEDGLPGNEFIENAGFRSQKGELFFGSLNGLISFFPSQLKDDPYLPSVALTRLRIGGRELNTDALMEVKTPVTLGWPDNSFEFEFAVLNYRQMQKNQYAYRLEGMEQDWNRIGNRRYGRYTSLQGGKYTLHLIGSNDDNLWNENGVSIDFEVVPPFWQTNSFRWGSILVAALVIILGSRLWIYRVQISNRLLANQVEERTREIERRRRAAEVLREVIFLLNSEHPLQESLCFITQQARRLTGASKASLLHRDAQGKMELVASDLIGAFEYNTSCPEIYPEEVMEWLANKVKEGPFNIVNDLGSIYPHPPIFFKSLHSLILVTIMAVDGVYGYLVVMFEQRKVFTTEEMELLKTLADQAALAIGNSRLREKVEGLAVISERNRLARDLHDAVTQTLFSACLIAEALPEAWSHSRKEGLQLLQDLRQLNRGALAEMRSLLMELRPTALIEARFSELLRQLAEAITGRTGMQVDLEAQEIPPLPQEVHVGMYRILQEALSNVTKHANASRVLIDLSYEMLSPDGQFRVILEVEDNGCGFDPKYLLPDNFGLINMHERARAINAVLEIKSQPGQGTCVRLVWEGRK
jgi:ligand-binding sensor domain-containing protein/signal transduction histidine kinase